MDIINDNSEDNVTMENSILALGGYHSMIIKNNELYAWGQNNYGQLGIGNKIDKTTPQKIKVMAI